MDYVDGAERTADIDYLLDWACLTACHARGNADGIGKYRTILETKGEAQTRLQQFQSWRKSTAFTEREKAVLNQSPHGATAWQARCRSGVHKGSAKPVAWFGLHFA